MEVDIKCGIEKVYYDLKWRQLVLGVIFVFFPP